MISLRSPHTYTLGAGQLRGLTVKRLVTPITDQHHLSLTEVAHRSSSGGGEFRRGDIEKYLRELAKHSRFSGPCDSHLFAAHPGEEDPCAANCYRYRRIGCPRKSGTLFTVTDHRPCFASRGNYFRSSAAPGLLS